MGLCVLRTACGRQYAQSRGNPSLTRLTGISIPDKKPKTPGVGDVGLAARPPLAAAALLAFLATRAIPGVEEVAGGRYRRTLADGGVIEIEAHAEGVTVRGRDDPETVTRAARLFDVTTDPTVVDAELASDPLLAPLVARRPGLRVPGAWDGFELVVRAVLGQQVSVAAASTLAGRLVTAAGWPLPAEAGTLTHAFPAPAALAEADLSRIGVPQRRAATLRALAAAVAEGTLNLEPAAERATEGLLAIPGVGPWTAAYVAMRVFGDPDALPAADLGLRRVFEAAGLPGDPASIRRRAERWRPWRSYAVMHLWTALGDQGG
jgi:AraC family transcriptional regulator of adaptative response / DNA-3-methyladenine glycosylase II